MTIIVIINYYTYKRIVSWFKKHSLSIQYQKQVVSKLRSVRGFSVDLCNVTSCVSIHYVYVYCLQIPIVDLKKLLDCAAGPDVGQLEIMFDGFSEDAGKVWDMIYLTREWTVQKKLRKRKE